MANKARGETSIEIGGVRYTVSLNLGALAEIEDAMGVETFEEALDFSKPSARRMRLLIVGLLKGNGHDVDAAVERSVNQMGLPEFMTAITDLMTHSGLSATPATEGEAADPLSVANAGASG